MKKLLLLSVAVVAMSAGAATAADMPVKAPWRPTCPAAWFEGAYIGINGGAAMWTANRTDQDGVIIDTTTVGQKTVGGVVGGQIGYNWTRCNTLFGIEVDGDWSGAKVTTRFLPNAVPVVNVNVTSRFDGLVTGRARAGFVLDNLLFYVTGGVAGARFHTTWTNFAPFPPPPVLLQADIGEWTWGWVAGFGTEWAWNDRVSLRAETLYIDFVDREHVVPALPANFTHGDSLWLSRVGINVKFGGPVVAAY
jgi:outer membrane immunogenic protein